MKTLMFFCSLLLTISTYAQNLAVNAGIGTYLTFSERSVDDKPDRDVSFFLVADRYPEFPGGEQEMIEYISEHIQYPELAHTHGHEGTVVVEFIVEPDGRISSPKVLRGIGMGCDEAALAVFKDMPRWSPAYQGGRPIPVKYVTPVKFRLY